MPETESCFTTSLESSVERIKHGDTKLQIKLLENLSPNSKKIQGPFKVENYQKPVHVASSGNDSRDDRS